LNTEFDFLVEIAGVVQAKTEELDSDSLIAQGLLQTLISDLPCKTSLVKPEA
jgi:hypothetical protein